MSFASSGHAVICVAAGLLGGTIAGLSKENRIIAGIVALAIGCVMVVIP